VPFVMLLPKFGAALLLLAAALAAIGWRQLRTGDRARGAHPA
jgi:hypothetical protein